MAYHNPYHFVPVNGDEQDSDLPRNELLDSDHEVAHDRYVDGAYSGRLICRLTTLTPIFLGGKRTKGSFHRPAQVKHFVLHDKPADPAIPASSLRGLISSLAEAASNSSLRVLSEVPHEYKVDRQPGFFNAHEYFGAISKELLPFNPRRDIITIAEQLFGFVEQNLTQGDAMSLAGRVWFSHARLQSSPNGNPWLPEVTLKILDKPKPPSPALYCKMVNGQGYISKAALNPGDHEPQGRKFYLHNQEALNWDENDPTMSPWATENQPTPSRRATQDDRFEQKSTVKPVRAASVFYFHLDFDNLWETELGLLLFALQPTSAFRHKIGMGKSIGLGTVKIEPVGMFLVDRNQRYTLEGLNATRYNKAWEVDKPVWPENYRTLYGSNPLAEDDVRTIRHSFEDEINQDILQALKLIGEPEHIRAQVHTPLVAGGHPEKETFKWFVANDIGSGSHRDGNRIDPRKEFLEPLNQSAEELPILNEHPWVQR